MASLVYSPNPTLAAPIHIGVTAALALKCATHHKSTDYGLKVQIEEASRVLQVSPEEMKNKLSRMGYGATHDRLDAFLSAWVASLDETNRKAFGSPPDDVIWVPTQQSHLASNPSVEPGQANVNNEENSSFR